MTPSSTDTAAGRRIAVARPYARTRVAGAVRHVLHPVEWDRIRLICDVVVLCCASSIALIASPNAATSISDRLMALAFPIVTAGLMRTRRAPDERLSVSLVDMFAYVLGVVSLSTMLIISVDSILGGSNPLRITPRLWVFGVVYLGMARATLVSVRRHAMRNPAAATPTLIVGAGVIGSQLVRRLTEEPRYGLRPVAFLDSDPLPTLSVSSHPTVPVVGGTDDIAAVIERTGARHVILAFTAEPDHVLVKKVRECEALGVTVSLVPRLYESINERASLDYVGGLPLLTLNSVNPMGWQFGVKHAIDRTLAALALLIASPLMVAVALAVRLSSSGPTLFRQRRVGRDGQEFTMLKFRTMRGTPVSAGESDAGWAAAELLRDVPHVELDAPAPAPVASVDRTTRIGRFLRRYSIDELPQLINVLRGDMSLVGPRPERVAYVRNFERSVDRYADRHRVKSGLTGWAQVNGLRGQTSIADRVEWDNYYIQNWSLRLDMRIIVLTLAEILRRDSADHRPGAELR